MIKISELSNPVKALAAPAVAFVTIGGFVAAAYGHFQTDAEALFTHDAIRLDVAQKEQNQLDVYKQSRIDRHQREIDRIEFQLLSDDLTGKQVAYLNRKVSELVQLIACIRRNEC